MKIFENDPDTRSAFQPTAPVVTEDGSISAFRSGDTSALRALETIVEPGTVIDGYEVGKLIGRGGIAAVYEAVKVESGEAVALKILDARFSHTPEVVARFLTEAETLASFTHANIVKYLGHGQDETFVYLAMEYVAGITLDQLAHAISLEPRHFSHLAHEISKGLTCVHSQGMIHGDIKPSNILVTRPGEVKISDFGAAARAATQSSRATSGKVHGTSSYMAPELLKANRQVDYRADIFSLAVTFYKVFTGQLPAQPYVPPSQLNETLPEGIDGIIGRALQPDPEDRYVTVKEFSDALAHLFDESAKTTPVPITPDRQSVEAAEAEAQDKIVAASNLKEREGVDWRLIAILAVVAIVIAVVAVAVVLSQS